jgi:hypothetical protein
VTIGVHDVINAIDEYFPNEPFVSGQLIPTMQLSRHTDIKNLFSYIYYLKTRGIIVQVAEQAKGWSYSTPPGKTAKQAHIDWLAAQAKKSKALTQRRGGPHPHGRNEPQPAFLLGSINFGKKSK